MTSGEDTFLASLREAYRGSQQSIQAPAFAGPACPSLPRLAQAAAEGWQEHELAHVAGCSRCQRIMGFEFRVECPGWAVLAHFAAGDSPFAAALARHLEEDCDGRCQRRLASPWLRATAAMLGTGAQAETVLQESLQHLASATVSLAAAPAFLPMGSETAVQVHAVGPDGLIATTLKREGPDLVAYVESPSTSLAGHTVTVELLGQTRQVRAQVILRMVDGVGAFGFHSFGNLANLTADLGPECEILAILDK
ncbi:MAG: hypothetical protein ABSG65_01855 [Bryobacteraceae bacterium]|jgi:hypothetical protein